MIYSLCLILIAIGLYGVLTKKNLVKIIISIIIIEYGLHMLIICMGYRRGGESPILEKGADISKFVATSVDPLPQAIVLISIGISLGLLALMVAICIKLYEKYGTFDITEMRKLKG